MRGDLRKRACVECPEDKKEGKEQLLARVRRQQDSSEKNRNIAGGALPQGQLPSHLYQSAVATNTKLRWFWISLLYLIPIC